MSWHIRKDTYYIGEQRRLRQACTSTQFCQSLRCKLTLYMELEEASDKRAGISDLTSDWALRIWRISNHVVLRPLFSCDGWMFCNLCSRISVESLESQSALRSDDHDHADSPSYNEIDDDSLLADFKMPDLSVSHTILVCGQSLLSYETGCTVNVLKIRTVKS